jgi:threonylcarbamoyladenosine tRNA methylthiotransferase MtaB
MLGKRKRRAFHDSLVGRTCQVLFESEIGNDWASGLTEEYARVVVKSVSTLVNQILPVQILEARNDKCIGILPDGEISMEHSTRNSSCEVMPAI